MSFNKFSLASKNPEKQFNIFIVTTIIVILVGIFYFLDILFPFILGAILAFVVDPWVKQLTKLKIKRSYSIIIVCILIIGMAVFLVHIIPIIIIQLSKLISSISSNLNMQNPYVQKVLHFFEHYGINFDTESILSSLNHNFSSQINALFSSFIGLISSSLKFLVSCILTMLTLYYILQEKDGIIKKLKLLVPSHKLDQASHLTEKIIKHIHSYVNSMILLAFIIFSFMFVILHVFDSPFATVLSIFSGIISIVPYLGAVIQVIIIALIQLIQIYPLINIVWLIVIQILFFTFMAFYLHPLVTGKSVHIHPLIVILCLVLGENIGGIFGMIVAVPFYILIKTIFLFYFEKYKNNTLIEK